jgi:hypothetical protein
MDAITKLVSPHIWLNNDIGASPAEKARGR